MSKQLPWQAGEKAAREGIDFTANPHSNIAGGVQEFNAWFAGWCYGKNYQKFTPAGVPSENNDGN